MDPRPSTSPPSLPIELTDLIVDDLQSNHQALLSCSLVSRDWLPRSRHHLFRQLRCHPQTSDGFSELWSFFQSSPADLRGVVRELTLDGTQTSFRAATHHNGSDPNDYHLTFPLLASCVALLPSLESLKLTNIFLGGVGGGVDVTEVGRMKKPQHRIKNLWLYGIRSSRNGGRFCSVVDVHAILALFGVVDQLSLSYLGFFPLDQELQSSVATYFGPRFQTRVQNLKVAHRCTRLDTLLEFLRRRHMLEQTNHLAIRVSDRIGSEFPFHTIGSQFSSMELDIGDNALLLPRM